MLKRNQSSGRIRKCIQNTSLDAPASFEIHLHLIASAESFCPRAPSH